MKFLPAHFVWRDANGKVRSSVKPHNVKMSKKERKEVQNSQGKDQYETTNLYLLQQPNTTKKYQNLISFMLYIVQSS